MTTAALQASAPTPNPTRRWLDVGEWLRRHADAELDARERALASLPPDFEARASRADRGRRETTR